VSTDKFLEVNNTHKEKCKPKIPNPCFLSSCRIGKK